MKTTRTGEFPISQTPCSTAKPSGSNVSNSVSGQEEGGRYKLRPINKVSERACVCVNQCVVESVCVCEKSVCACVCERSLCVCEKCVCVREVCVCV